MQKASLKCMCYDGRECETFWCTHWYEDERSREVRDRTMVAPVLVYSKRSITKLCDESLWRILLFIKSFVTPDAHMFRDIRKLSDPLNMVYFRFFFILRKILQLLKLHDYVAFKFLKKVMQFWLLRNYICYRRHNFSKMIQQ